MNKLNLKSQKDWKKWNNESRPTFIPSAPHQFYSTEWKGFGYWLGIYNTKPPDIQYYTYDECFNIISKYSLRNREAFYKWTKEINTDIRFPNRPDYIYRNSGWHGWDSFLNSETPSPINKSALFLSYKDAVEYLKDKKLQKYDDYVEYVRSNKLYFLPLRPDRIYNISGDWNGYVEYLSKGRSNRQSYGEMQIEKYLKVNNIIYFKEYKFLDCINLKPLPFDFYLPKQNLCIEYDGELHYRSTKMFGGDESLRKINFNDNIKTQYCLNNKINLLRIGYKEQSQINKILQEHL